MGGTCLGSLLFPRFALHHRHPLRVYAAIELGIGGLGLLVLLLMPYVGGIYTAWSGYGLPGFLLRGTVAAICLLPPTLLMGATLPALARQVRPLPDGVSWLGLFYGGNIAGAVIGCLVAGFYLLRNFDATTATLVAAGINIVVAAMAVFLSTAAPWHRLEENTGGFSGFRQNAVIYLVIGISGFCALAAEAIWTRVLGLLLGASVYTFSIILAVFLVGLGIGSGLASVLRGTIHRPHLALGWCQLLTAGAIAWTAYTLSSSLPYWPINPAIPADTWIHFQLDINRALWALLPPTLLWGASFPLAVAAVESRGAPSGLDPARVMSSVYAANTVGAIAGALGASLLLVSWVGSQRVEQLLIALSVAAGLLLLMPGRVVLGVSAVSLAGFLIYSVPPTSALLIAHGRYAATWVGKSDILYTAEGLNASVAVSDFPGVRTFHVAGKIQASNVARDMRLQRMLGHLTTLIAANPRSVLVIGCGAGVTAGAVSLDPRVERETIVEIEPVIPEAASRFFRSENFDVLRNPKVQVHIDDGRHYLLTTNERFDAITADPLDPWVKGAANLYTREFFEVAKQRLNPGGVITMYVQLFETNTAAVKSLVATFFEAFPDGTMWGNTVQGKGYDMVLLGQNGPTRIDLDEVDRRLGSPEYSRLAQSLVDVGMSSALDLFETYAGRKSDVTGWLKDAVINRDRNLRMQYLAGFALNLDDSDVIYAEIIADRRFPDDLFVSAEGRVDFLRARVETNSKD